MMQDPWREEGVVQNDGAERARALHESREDSTDWVKINGVWYRADEVPDRKDVS